MRIRSIHNTFYTFYTTLLARYGSCGKEHIVRWSDHQRGRLPWIQWDMQGLFIINIMIFINVSFEISSSPSSSFIILVIIMLSVTRFLQRDEQWSNTDGVIPWWITWRLSLNRWLPRHWPQWTSGNWALCRHCPFWRDHLGMYSAKLIRCPFLMLESKY